MAENFSVGETWRRFFQTLDFLFPELVTWPTPDQVLSIPPKKKKDVLDQFFGSGYYYGIVLQVAPDLCCFSCFRNQFLHLLVWQHYLRAMFCDFCVNPMPYKQGRDVNPSDRWWTLTRNDGDLSSFRWILILLELGLQIVMLKKSLFVSLVTLFHCYLAFFEKEEDGTIKYHQNP